MSRLTIFLQGVLLAVTAILFFVAGMTVGRRSGNGNSASNQAEPAELSGRVLYLADTRTKPDSGAVAVLLPVETRPETKLEAAGLRPSDPRVSDLHPSLETIHRWGGDYVRADDSGRFRLRVPRGGSFFLLILSAHAGRGSERPELKDLAQIGRFFFPAVDLLDDRAYDWRTVTLRGRIELPDHVFDHDSS